MSTLARHIHNDDHVLNCKSPHYFDTRWDARPQYYRQGNTTDIEWLKYPLQPPYQESDVHHMSSDINMWRNSQNQFKPEVAPDPCIPHATKYCSFGKSVWEYDSQYPSLTHLHKGKSCHQLRGKSSIPDVACLDQQDKMKNDPYENNKNLLYTKN
jgi:hypothetical protein